VFNGRLADVFNGRLADVFNGIEEHG